MILLIIGVTCAIMTAKYVCDCLKELESALDFFRLTLVQADINPRGEALGSVSQLSPLPRYLLFQKTSEGRDR